MIAILPGDGIGPEVMAVGVRVLRAVCDLEVREAPIGGAAIDAHGDPLPEDTLKLCREAEAVLLGAVGGPKWTDPRAEDGLLRLRKELGLFANLRPIKPYPALAPVSPVKEEITRDVDLLFVRELTGGIYFGKKWRDEHEAGDTCVYSEEEIERIVQVAINLAGKRRNKLTSIDKANVLETSRLWRSTVDRMVTDYPELGVQHLLVDAAAMHLLQRPRDFDVLLTENMFGDILTDEASVLCGSLGMLPSASLGPDKKGLYEPVHGSAPDIAGRNRANPYGMVLSVSMMLRHSLGLPEKANQIETAVAMAVQDGILSSDAARKGVRRFRTSEIGDAILRLLG